MNVKAFIPLARLQQRWKGVLLGNNLALSSTHEGQKDYPEP